MYTAVYHPRITVEETVTRFGAIETNVPKLYEQPIAGKAIYRIDTLYALERDWGDVMRKSRDNTYLLLSGNCSDYVYHKILQYFYKDFKEFRGYVNIQAIMGDRDVSVLYRIVSPMRKKVDKYYEDVLMILKNISAKVVMRTHDYVYFVLPDTTPMYLHLDGLIKIE